VLASFSDADLRLMLDFQQRAGELFQRETERLRAAQRPAAHGPDFSAPLGNASSACLEFATGAFELRLRAGDDAALLYRALFEGAQPTVRVQGGTVSFRHRRMSLLDWNKHSGIVLLNSSLPWTIVLRQGVSQSLLDLRDLDLRQLSILGGANKTDIALPVPTARVPLLVEGGLSRVTIRHPPGVPAQLRVAGGANRLAFDGQRFGAVGGEVRLASPGWDLASQRYDLEVQGGASRLEVSELKEASAAHRASTHTAQEETR
ncbi:MAG: MarR family winged helix-turn-helix transcriptional regulator, partial [Chloroflexota bacterium]